MDPVERAPCPHCAEATALAARICPRCGRSQLVDVVAAVALEPRTAYETARALAGLDAGIALGPARQALVLGPGAVVAAGLTRELAMRVIEVVAEHGGAVRIEPAAGAVDASGPSVAATSAAAPASPARLLIGLVALVGVGVLVWALSGPGRGGEGGGAPRDDAASGAEAAAQATARPGRAGSRPPAVALTAREVGSLAAASTASLRCGSSLGSGFFVGPGLLLTNAHVVCGEAAEMQVVLADGRKLSGRVERLDAWLDAALVRLDPNLEAGSAPPLALGDAAPLRQGDRVYFYGSPKGLDFTLAQAIVSHPSRFVRGISYVQIDGNVNPGNSGGPLLDEQGRVVGIVSMKVADGEGLGLALPVNYLYATEPPLATAPAGVDRVAWEQLAARAEAADAEEVAALVEGGEHPLLAGGFVTADGELLAVVVRRGEIEPWAESLRFTASGADAATGDLRELCVLGGETEPWRQVASLDELDLDARTRQWLERHQLGFSVWAAAVPLAGEDCPTPAALLGAGLALDAVADGASPVVPIQYLPVQRGVRRWR